MSNTPETPAAIPKAETPAAGNALLGQLKRLRQGDSGMLPIIIGLVVLGGYFQFRSSTFLSANNLTDLFVQATIFILLGMAEIWLLLLGDIDLSVGWIMALGSAAAVILVDQQFHWPWYLAFALSIAITTLIGTIQGLLTIALKVPSFIVTLAGLFVWEGVAIFVIDRQGLGGTIPVHGGVLYDLVNVNLTPVFTWIVLLAVAGAMGFLILNKDRSRRTSGLESLPFFVSLFKVIALIIGAIVLALIFNTNRGGGIFASQQGMPWAVPIVLFVLAAGSFILTRTKAGRYLYAIGGNTEAARRAGVRVNRYRKVTKPEGHTWKSFAELLLASMPPNMEEHYRNKVLLHVKWWQERGFPEGIPDEAPYELEAARKSPSWRRVCKSLLRNDYWGKGLGFSQHKSDAYKAYLNLMKRRKAKWGLSDTAVELPIDYFVKPPREGQIVGRETEN